MKNKNFGYKDDQFQLTLMGLPTIIFLINFSYIPMFGLIIAFKDLSESTLIRTLVVPFSFTLTKPFIFFTPTSCPNYFSCVLFTFQSTQPMRAATLRKMVGYYDYYVLY